MHGDCTGECVVHLTPSLHDLAQMLICVLRWCCRWRRPHGRAFELVMCELKRRALGAAGGKIQVDWDRCEIKCGDDEAVSLRELGR